MSNTIPLEKVRNKLARIWFIGTAFPFLLIVIQTLLLKYEPKTQEVWAWFIPLVFPTITLMVAVMGAEAFTAQARKVVRKGFSMITCYLSFAYIVVLFLVILLEPISEGDSLKIFSISTFFLGPLQAVVVAAIGYLFTGEAKTETTSTHKTEVVASNGVRILEQEK
jgi:hypothetical protein